MIVLNCISIMFFIDFIIHFTKEMFDNFKERTKLTLLTKQSRIRLALFLITFFIASSAMKDILYAVLILYVFLLCWYIDKKSRQEQIQHLYAKELKHLKITTLIIMIVFVISYFIFHRLQ